MSIKYEKLKNVYNNFYNSSKKWSDFKIKSRRGAGVYANININEWSQLQNNFNETFKIMTVTIARTLAGVAVDLLSTALPRTPIDTGELRESGTASLSIGRKKFIVGTGTKQGTVNVDLSSITGNALKGAKTLSANISFKRFSMDKGELVDIALWTHETLLPYVDRPDSPAARTPGTGPKYLEIPFYEKFNTYQYVLTNGVFGSVQRNISEAAIYTSRKKKPFEVDSIKIVSNRIRKSGYFGIKG